MKYRERAVAFTCEGQSLQGVACGPIYAIDQIYSDPQVKHLGLVEDVETPDARGVLHFVGQPVTLTRTPSRRLRRA